MSSFLLFEDFFVKIIIIIIITIITNNNIPLKINNFFQGNADASSVFIPELAELISLITSRFSSSFLFFINNNNIYKIL